MFDVRSSCNVRMNTQTRLPRTEESFGEGEQLCFSPRSACTLTTVRKNYIIYINSLGLCFLSHVWVDIYYRYFSSIHI